MGRNLAHMCCLCLCLASCHAASICLQVSEVLDPRMLPPWPPPVPPAESEMNGAVKLKQTSSYHRSYHLGQEFQVHPGPGETEKDRRGRQLPNFLLVAASGHSRHSNAAAKPSRHAPIPIQTGKKNPSDQWIPLH
jgi:hypothetical protein